MQSKYMHIGQSELLTLDPGARRQFEKPYPLQYFTLQLKKSKCILYKTSNAFLSLRESLCSDSAARQQYIRINLKRMLHPQPNG